MSAAEIETNLLFVDRHLVLAQLSRSTVYEFEVFKLASWIFCSLS